MAPQTISKVELSNEVANHHSSDQQITNNLSERIATKKRGEFSAEDKSLSLEILRKYKQNPSARLRNQLVQLNIGLVKKEVTYWLHQSAESYEDLLQVGAIGLIGAIERFEMDRGYAFSSFATRYIRGEIQHYLRDKRHIVRIPRRWQELYDQAYRVVRQLRLELRREPLDREIAAALEVSGAEWSEVKLAHQNRSPMSLDAPVSNHDLDSACLLELVADPKCATQTLQEDALRLHQALAHLDDRTREIVEYVFLEDITQREVAKMYGVSAVTISRQVKKGLSTLRSILVEAA
jgi:RNA polymerase sigma-B factor